MSSLISWGSSSSASSGSGATVWSLTVKNISRCSSAFVGVGRVLVGAGPGVSRLAPRRSVGALLHRLPCASVPIPLAVVGKLCSFGNVAHAASFPLAACEFAPVHLAPGGCWWIVPKGNHWGHARPCRGTCPRLPKDRTRPETPHRVIPLLRGAKSLSRRLTHDLSCTWNPCPDQGLLHGGCFTLSARRTSDTGSEMRDD